MLVASWHSNGIGFVDRMSPDILTCRRDRSRHDGQFDGDKSTVSGGTVGALMAAGAVRPGA